MIRSTPAVLREKKGLAIELGFVAFTMAMILLAGSMVAAYTINSKQNGQLQAVSQAIQNRAEVYASALNQDLTNPQVPALDRQCSSTTATCTQIVSVTPTSDGKTAMLRIQGDTVQAFGQSLTQDVTLRSEEVTHVTAIDADGSNVWGLSSEGLRYKAWSVASGKPSDVEPADLEKGATWVDVDDRAGVDSTGSLWVWGANNLGQAGVGGSSDSPIQPKKLSIDGVDFRSVVTADDRAYAIDSRGYGWAWGKDGQGQLGDGNTNARNEPWKIPAKRWQMFAVGRDSVYGITAAGDLMVAGTPPTDSSLSVGPDTGDGWHTVNKGTRYTDVAASTSGLVAMISESGALSSFGGVVTYSAIAGQKFASVSVAATVGYAISTDAHLFTWGQGNAGELGRGSVTSSATPSQVSDHTFVQVAGGAVYAFAIDTTGALFYTGTLPAPRYGAGQTMARTFTALSPDTQFRQVVMSGADPVAALLDSDGNIYANGTTTAGLWPTSYSGPTNQPIRMPVPDDFPSYTWK